MAPIVLWKASKIISVSEDAAALLKKETNKDILICPNGVDLDLFGSAVPYRFARCACYVGRLDKDKVVERMFEIDLPLKFIGPDEDGGRKKLEELNLTARHDIMFTERAYEQMPDAYDQCRYVVLPSKYEGFPLTLLESIAMGRPFISTDVGQVKETFLALGLGDLFLLKEGENIGDKIRELEKTRGIDDILVRAREVIKYDFSWDVVCKKITGVYLEAMK